MNQSSTSRRTQRVNSRVAKVESKKALRQTILIAIASVVLLITFTFVIIPGAIRLLSTGEISIGESDTVPPQIPSISVPPEAVNQPTLQLNGFSEVGSEVVVLINGEEHTRFTVESEDGAFSTEVQLLDGENSVKLYAIDQAENESETSRSYLIMFDNQAPTIALEMPQDQQQFELSRNQNIEIKGVTEPESRVFVNGRLTRPDDEGLFSTRYQLQEGENKLTIKAEDKAGNEVEQEITVFFRF